MSLPATAQSPEATKPKKLGYQYSRHLGERLIEAVLFLAAFASVGITISIVVMLVRESVIFF